MQADDGDDDDDDPLSAEAAEALRQGDPMRVELYARAGAYGGGVHGVPVFIEDDDELYSEMPPIALAIRHAGPFFAEVLDVLVRVAGVDLAAAFEFRDAPGAWRRRLTPLTQVIASGLGIPLRRGGRRIFALRVLLEALGGGIAQQRATLVCEDGRWVGGPDTSLPAFAVVMFGATANVGTLHMLLPLLAHGAVYRATGSDPRRGIEAALAGAHRVATSRYQRGVLSAAFFAFFEAPPHDDARSLAAYVRADGSDLVLLYARYFRYERPSAATIHTLCALYGAEVSDAALDAAQEGPYYRCDDRDDACSAEAMMRAALLAARGDRRVAGVQLYRGLGERLAPELAHAILRAPGVHLPALGAAAWLAAHRGAFGAEGADAEEEKDAAAAPASAPARLLLGAPGGASPRPSSM